MNFEMTKQENESGRIEQQQKKRKHLMGGKQIFPTTLILLYYICLRVYVRSLHLSAETSRKFYGADRAYEAWLSHNEGKAGLTYISPVSSFNGRHFLSFLMTKRRDGRGGEMNGQRVLIPPSYRKNL